MRYALQPLLRLHASVQSLTQLIVHLNQSRGKTPPHLPMIAALPSIDSMAFASDRTGQWDVSLITDTSIEGASDFRADIGHLIPGLVSKMVQYRVQFLVPYPRITSS